MAIIKFISVKLLLCLIIGVITGYYFEFNLFYLFLFIGVSAICLGSLRLYKKYNKSFLFGFFTAFTTICIGIASITLSQSKNFPTHYSNQNLKENSIIHFKIREILRPNLFSNRYIASVLQMDGTLVYGKLALNINMDSTVKNIKIDDEIIAKVQLKEIKAALNPHQFNYKTYMKGLNISHQVQLNSKNYFSIQNSSKTVYGIAANIRKKIILKLNESDFGSEEIAVIQALLLGQRNDISPETYEDYKNAGAVHILALSGLHIGIILLFLQFILSPIERFKYGKKGKLLLIVILLWCFALLAGFSASIIRAVTMFSFLSYAHYLNRPTNTFNILALSMFFIVLIKPLLLFQVGFQMSYAAVFAIIWIYPLLEKCWNPRNWVIKKIWQLLCVSIAAQLGILPISLFYFHQFPGLFFISNLVIIPFMGTILGFGIIIIILALLNILPEFIALSYNTLIFSMNAVVKWIGRQESFIFTEIPFDFVQLLLGYLCIISLILMCTKTIYNRVVIFLFGIISFQLWCFYAIYNTQKTVELTVLHKHRNTTLLYKAGNTLSILSSNKITATRAISNYKIAERITEIQYSPLEEVYMLGRKNLYVLDSLGIYPPYTLQADYILLTHSPKINLERLIDSIAPKQIIADGSNYKSYISRWEKTSAKRKLPFHYTGEKGAYYFK